MAAKASKAKKSVKKAAPRKRGRPSIFSTALVDRICLRLIDGESLRSICRDPAMPSMSTIWNWYRNEKVKEDFLQRFLRARAFQSLVMDGDLQDVANDSSRDFTTVVRDGEEVEIPNHEHIQRSKLRCDIMWRRMVSMNREMFGDKVDVKHGGEVAVTGLDAKIEEARKRVGKG